MAEKKYEVEVAGQKMVFRTGKLALQANASVLASWAARKCWPRW